MTDWVALCRRTEDPKLMYIENWLDELGIQHRRNGFSFHGPILEVPESDHERAYDEILLAPDEDFGIFDERPDDDSMFEEYAHA